MGIRVKSYDDIVHLFNVQGILTRNAPKIFQNGIFHEAKPEYRLNIKGMNIPSKHFFRWPDTNLV